MECKSCGAQVDDNARVCTYCSSPLQGGGQVSAPTSITGNIGTAAPSASNKISAGLCGIFLGSIGIHKFVLGYTKPGLIMLGIAVLSGGLLAPITALIGLIEGIIYLTKTDEDFINTYVINKKEWF